MTTDLAGAFDHPIRQFLLFKSAFITDPSRAAFRTVFNFTPLIFAGCYTEHFITTHPQLHFAAAFGTIAMRINGLGKPYTILESEGFIGERSYRTNINDVADKIVIQTFLNIGRDLGMIPAIEHTMYPLIGYLISRKHTTVAKNTAGHVELDILTQIVFLKRTTFEFVAGSFAAVFIAEVLQMTFTGLVTNGAIQRVIDQ